jgi:hypothetical protein
MNRTSVNDFRRAIRVLFGAYAVILGCDLVGEQCGRTVLVFELLGHPTASKCFAWEENGEIIAVLAEGAVQSAVDAVNASV